MAARFLVYGTALAVTLVGCGGGDGGGGPAPVATTVTITPSPATVQSGNTVALTATVRDQNGAVMTGQTVSWSSSNTTNATVSASGVVTGKVAGTSQVTASVGAVTSPAITVTVTAGVPATLTKVGDLAATMPGGTSDSVRVRVRDAHGNGVPGVTVTFSVAGTGATITSVSAITNVEGNAGVRLTVGPTAGVATTVTVSAASLTPVTFTTTTTDAPRVVTTITITPSPTASLQSGATLQMTAVVRDQFGDIMSSQTVTWATSNSSRATVTSGGLVTGFATGTVNITASIGSVISNVVTLTITAGAATQLVKVGDLAATMAAGLSDSVRVRALDAQGNGVPGITVTFGVSGGGATISATSRVTDANGHAGVSLTVGSIPGHSVTVTVTAAGLTPVTFVTNIVTGPPARLRFTSPRTLVIQPGSIVPTTIALTDEAGNLISPPPTITYMSRTPSVATVNANGEITGVSTGQSIIVAEVASAPTVRDSMIVVVATATSVVLLSDLPRFDLKADTTFTIGIHVDMRASGEKLGSTRVQVSWNPATLTYQSDAEGVSGVGATVNSSNAVAGGVLTLAMASSTGFSGIVELRRITFRANATAGRTTSLVLVATELNGIAPTFTDLKARTIAVTYPISTR